MEMLNKLLLILSINYCYSQLCPQPKVFKRTTIDRKISNENGAKLLKEIIVSTARECYRECCDVFACNFAQMHYFRQGYSTNGEEIMEKRCYLFDCGSPSVCKFKDNEQHRFAVIEVPKIRNKPTEAKATAPATTEKEKEKEQPGEKCPPGAPVAMCADNPCKSKTCPSHKNAVCKPSYCGGCYAKFYDSEGKQVQCAEPKAPVLPIHNEETVEVASTDYEEQPVDELPVPSKVKLPEPTGDPYFQSDRRKWIDGTEPGQLTNASKPNGKTTKVPDTIPEKKIIVVNNSFMSVPLLIALSICIVLILGLIYRFKCAPRGKAKKFPVDDGDYLINGMYL